jgi:serine-type D-Ala-D-Ala carboxypeptidase/endopeptidase (penicillin-binding protein 4)
VVVSTITRNAPRYGRAWLVFPIIILNFAVLASLAATDRQAAAQELRPERSDIGRFQQRVETALSEGIAGKGHWGVLVTDANSGDVLFALNQSQYFTPASNTKLFTTILALATLGPDHRIRTTVETKGVVDRMGVLRGNLVLVGRGDANLSNRVFPYTKQGQREGPSEKALAELADQVARRGVKQIEGDVVADDSYLAPDRFPSGWTVDDTVWSYGGAVSAIAVNDNSLTIEVRPGDAVGAPLGFSLEPSSTIYKVRDEAFTTAPGTEAQLRLARDPESRIFVLSGTLPLTAPRRPLLVAVQEPAENAAVLFEHLLEARGVRITGQARARHANDLEPATTSGAPVNVLAERVSPPLIEDVRLTNKISDNLHAELMLRIAAKESGGAEILDDALKFAQQFRTNIGIAPEDVVLKDGSGLSRDDLATPESFVKLLEYAAHQPWGADFVKTLPIAGEDGTLENRMKGTAAAGRIQAKTGQVDHVEALSGFATTLRGERLIFSIMGDKFNSSGRDAAMIVDKICVAMVEELGMAPSPKTPEQQ